MTLAELAQRLGCRLEGDGAVDVTRVAGLEEAGPGDLTFLSNPKYASKLPATRASAVIAPDGVTTRPVRCCGRISRTWRLRKRSAILTPPARPAPGISPLAAIDPTAELGAGVSIGPFAVIGRDVRIGARTAIYPHAVVAAGARIGIDGTVHAHVSVREAVVIGDRVVIQDGAVVGADGFGFARRRDGTHQKIPQVGGVVIGDDVEIGAGTTIDRPAVGETRIASGTKIDNLVQVAHGVKIGKNALLAAQSGIAGSSVLEDDVVMAGQSGVTGHVRLGRGAMVGAKSAVTKDIGEGQHVAGVPAGPVADWRESAVLLRRLPELRQTLSDLQSRLAALEARMKP